MNQSVRTHRGRGNLCLYAGFDKFIKFDNFITVSSHHTCELLYEVRCVLHFLAVKF